MGRQSCQVILVDANSFLQGLDGAKGEKGDSGEKGDHGHTGPAVSCFSVSPSRPSTEPCKAAIPMLCYLLSPRVSRVLQGSLVYPVPKERR